MKSSCTGCTCVASEKRAWSFAVVVLLLCGVFSGGASISRTRVLRMSDGMLLDRYAIGGIRISSVDRQSVLHPLHIQPAEHSLSFEFELQKQSIWTNYPPPSSYANRLVSECSLLREVIVGRDLSVEEVAELWSQVVAKAKAREPIEPIILELVFPTKRE